MTTLLGFDFGLARIGIATGNTLTGTANPLCTLNSRDQKPDWDAITRIIEEWQPTQIIVGLPLRGNGEKSEMTKKAERFSRQLEGRYNLPVALSNEMLTSAEAEQRLKQTRQAGRKKKISKQDIDQLAATIILENWIQQNAKGL